MFCFWSPNVLLAIVISMFVGFGCPGLTNRLSLSLLWKNMSDWFGALWCFCLTSGFFLNSSYPLCALKTGNIKVIFQLLGFCTLLSTMRKQVLVSSFVVELVLQNKTTKNWTYRSLKWKTGPTKPELCFQLFSLAKFRSGPLSSFSLLDPATIQFHNALGLDCMLQCTLDGWQKVFRK